MKPSSNKFNFALGFFMAVLFITMLFHPAFAKNENDFDSLILVPKDTLHNSKRISRLMYRTGNLNFQKVKENIYVVPFNINDPQELKNTSIAELRNSNLFKIIEPNYNLYLDQYIPERNYTIITSGSEQNPPTVIDNLDSKEITPNDLDFASQYYLREINATKAWNLSTGADSIVVGILDTGIDSKHPDLAGKIILSSDLDGHDEVGHGTEVAGIIAANTNNNQGIAGIGWNTKILPIKITDDLGQAKVSTVVQALDEAYEKGVKIVQISLSTNQFSQVLKDAIKEALDRGILIVSTSGNTGQEELRYPAAFDGVIGVGAVDRAKEKESFSTTGEHVSLVAPGSSIYTTASGSTYSFVSGTSFSAPQVAGAAALVWSIAPNLSKKEVREILINSAEDLGDEGKDHQYGYGLLNTQKAVELAKAKVTPQIEENNIGIEKWIKR